MLGKQENREFLILKIKKAVSEKNIFLLNVSSNVVTLSYKFSSLDCPQVAAVP